MAVSDKVPFKPDVLILGGGIAGLWLLDHLHREGFSVILVENTALGAGQTIASQGILHGGLKYTLSNLVDPGARAVAQMPLLWRQCLAGQTAPDLSQTRVRAQFCHLWNTGSTRSRFGMTGAKMALRVKPREISHQDWPPALQGLQGSVCRLDEQVISPHSLIQNLADQHQPRLLQIDAESGATFTLNAAGHVQKVRLACQAMTCTLEPRMVVLAAGAGNASLRQSLNLDPHQMQRRPLHMVMVRGNLPTLNGHCTDFSRTRLTLTTDQDRQGHTVWQLGGQISEDGVDMSPQQLIQHTRSELQAVVPNLSIQNLQWATYRVDRAEALTRTGRRPESATAFQEGNIITAWPTKLVLAPQLSKQIRQQIKIQPAGPIVEPLLPSWRRPAVAQPPWETCTSWITAP